jgi:ABC-type branched-subunit amino acid transport system substrate-binding protein
VRNRVIVTAILAALALAACGRSSSPASSGVSTSSTTAGSATPTAATGDFGTLKDVCQKGSAAGSTDQGVTPTAIKIGTFADPGFAGRPGLDQELFDTAEVFSKWCNAAGGINGRKIDVDEHDSALFDVQAKMVEACQNDFFLVGGGAVFDNQGVKTRLQCLLPDIPGYMVTAEARGADLKVEPLPNPIDNLAVGEYRWLGKKYPTSTKKVGIITGDLPTTITVAKQAEEAVKKLGWDVVYNDQYPSTGPTSWAPYAQAMKDKGVQGVIWVGEPENLAKLETDMKAIDFAPQWVRADTNHYDQKLLDTGGDAIANTFIPSSFVPFQQAAKSPAMQQYLDEYAKYKPSAKAKALLGAQAWSAWLLFAESAKACGANLTRKCVYDNALKVHNWTGGGLHAPTDPGADKGSQCFTLLEGGNGTFKVVNVGQNATGFNCSPQNRMALTGNYGKGVKLSDVGKTINDLK